MRLLAALTLTGCSWFSSSTPVVDADPVVPAEVKSPLATLSGDADRIRAHLEPVVRTWGLDPDNAWAIGHAVLALGPDAKLPNGAGAVDHIFETWAQRSGEAVVFPRTVDGVPVEPHRDLMLKVMVDAGVAPDREVKVAGTPTTVAQLWRTSTARTWVDATGTSAASFNDLAWTLHGVSAWSPPDLRWTAEGRQASVDGLTHAVVQTLVADTAFMAHAHKAGQPLEKRGQGIFAYTCGGAHFLQAAAHAVARGFGERGDGDILRAQAELMNWRFDEELRITDEAIEGHPEYALLLQVQRLKFVGHYLETIHRLAALGFLEVNDANRERAQRARVELGRTVDRLRAMGVYDRMPSIRAEREQTYLDLVGDSAHAIRGLDLSTGAVGVRR